jgi:hypothetical protein
MYYLVGKVGARAGSGTAGLAKTHLFNFFLPNLVELFGFD